MLSLLGCLRKVGTLPEPNTTGYERGYSDLRKMTVGLRETAKVVSGSSTGVMAEVCSGCCTKKEQVLGINCESAFLGVGYCVHAWLWQLAAQICHITLSLPMCNNEDSAYHIRQAWIYQTVGYFASSRASAYVCGQLICGAMVIQ